MFRGTAILGTLVNFSTVLEIFAPTSGNIVAMVTTGQAAREQIVWVAATDTPAFQRMPPALNNEGQQLHGEATHYVPVVTLNTSASASSGDNMLYFASTTGVVLGFFVQSTGSGVVPGSFVIRVTDDSITLNRNLVGTVAYNEVISFFVASPMSPLYNVEFQYYSLRGDMAGALTHSLAPTDTQIFISVLLEDLSPKLWPNNPLQIPSAFGPGVIWINGERIEYVNYSRSGNDITLGVPTYQTLRRHTLGTTIQEQRQVVVGTGDGSPQTYDLDATNGTGPVEVMVDGLPFPDFTQNLVIDTLEITLTAPVGQYVTVAMTIGYTYIVGSAVYNASNTFENAVPIGIPVGNRELDPMHRIVAD